MGDAMSGATQIIPVVSYSFPVNGVGGAFGGLAALVTAETTFNCIELLVANNQGNQLVNLGFGSAPSTFQIPNIFFNGGLPILQRFPILIPKGTIISLEGTQLNGSATTSYASGTLIYDPDIDPLVSFTSYGQSTANTYYGFYPAASTSWQQMGGQIVVRTKKLFLTIGTGSDDFSFSVGFGPSSTSVTVLRTFVFFSSTINYSPMRLEIDEDIPAGNYLWINNNGAQDVELSCFGAS